MKSGIMISGWCDRYARNPNYFSRPACAGCIHAEGDGSADPACLAAYAAEAERNAAVLADKSVGDEKYAAWESAGGPQAR
jgi:hypothetical protein